MPSPRSAALPERDQHPQRALFDDRIVRYKSLPSPAQLLEELPSTPQHDQVTLTARADVTGALQGEDERLVVVVGPCSLHDPDAALDYAGRLAELEAELRDALIIIMRTYFEKPRTSIGWKGLIYDPDLDGSSDAATGLLRARRLLLDVGRIGLPCAVEVLDTITPQYQADLVAWAAIGARTVESQVHRQLASGLSMPVGFKNATDGSVDHAVNALSAAVSPHTFFGVDVDGQVVVVRTAGNDDAHVILRGGANGPNYERGHVEAALAAVRGVTGHARPVMVDASHGNSQKDHRRQAHVVRSVLEQFATEHDSGILGLMLESNICPGRQDWQPNTPLQYGVSITDACIGWEETVELLMACAQAVRSRRT